MKLSETLVIFFIQVATFCPTFRAFSSEWIQFSLSIGYMKQLFKIFGYLNSFKQFYYVVIYYYIDSSEKDWSVGRNFWIEGNIEQYNNIIKNYIFYLFKISLILLSVESIFRISLSTQKICKLFISNFLGSVRQ